MDHQMAWWTDLHNPLHGAGYCPDQESHVHDHVACPNALTDFLLCATYFMEQAVLNYLPRHNWTGNVFYKVKKGPIFSREIVFSSLDECSQDKHF
jgi:hypothetical protein